MLVGSFRAISTSVKKMPASYLSRPITQKGKIEFFDRVSQIDWSFVDCETVNAEGKFDVFMTRITDAYNNAFPEKSYRVQPEKPHEAGWFNNDLKNKREHLRFLYELNKQYGGRELLNIKNKYRSEYKRAIINAKKTYNDRLIGTSSCPSRTMWQIINSHSKKKQQKVTMHAFAR